nr:hypothetical protein [Leptospira noguchii]
MKEGFCVGEGSSKSLTTARNVCGSGLESKYRAFTLIQRKNLW